MSFHSHEELRSVVEQAWERRADFTSSYVGGERAAVERALTELDEGRIRVAEKVGAEWRVNEWVKKAVLLSFRFNPSTPISGGPGGGGWYDKVASKFAAYAEEDFKAAGFRAVPGSLVRRGAYVAKDVVLMPSFLNIGAFVDEGTMIDTWSTVGSCAQIGKRCHISGGVGIGGVLEPLQASPVIIEDDCFVGARSEIAEGVVVETGSVISMGVFLGASTKIVKRETGEIFYGRVPAYSVVVPGTLPGKALSGGGVSPSLYCAVIVKTVDEKTRSKTSLNDLLRD